MRRPPLPAPGSGYGRGAAPPDRKPVDSVPGQTQECRQQRHRRGHHHEHDDRDRDPRRGQEWDARDRQPQDRDEHRAAREHDGSTRRRHGVSGGGRDAHARGEVLTMAGHEQQGVVDADSQADHGRHHRRPARNLDEVTDEWHRSDAERQTEQGQDDGQAHRDQRSECDEQDDRGSGDAGQLTHPALGLGEGEEQIPARLHLQRAPDLAVPRRSQCGPKPLEVGGIELLHDRVLQRHARDAPVGGHRACGIGRVDDVRQRREAIAKLPGGGHGGGGAGERGAGRGRRQHDLRGQAGLRGARAVQQLDGALGIGPRHREAVLKLPAERRCRADHYDRQGEPPSDGHKRTEGGEATE